MIKLNLMQPYMGTYISAKLASVDLDVEGILKACHMIEKNACNVDVISKDIFDVGSNITSDALSVDEKNISGILDDCCSGIKYIHDDILNTINQVRKTAVNSYNIIQTQYNEEAKSLDLSLAKKESNVETV